MITSYLPQAIQTLLEVDQKYLLKITNLSLQTLQFQQTNNHDHIYS